MSYSNPTPPGTPQSEHAREIDLRQFGREDVIRRLVPIPVLSCGPRDPKDIAEDEDYQKFIESMVPFCHCDPRFRPCDGVLAGGCCDRQLEPDPDDDHDLP